MEKLIQKIQRDCHSFLLKSDGIEVRMQHGKNVQEYHVSFDEINKDELTTIKAMDVVAMALLGSVLLNAVLVAWMIIGISETFFEYGSLVIFGVFGIFMGLMYLMRDHFQKIDIKSLDAEKPLNFLYTNKTKAEVDTFIAAIRTAKRSYFRKKYFRVDPVIPYYEQKSRLLWLYEEGYITLTEHEVVDQDLENKRVIDGD